MSILGQGIDLVEIARIARVFENHGQRFLDRVLTPAEQNRLHEFSEPLAFIAGRWAAKEAILKALGTGWRGRIAWIDMSILPDDLGRPVVSLSGETARLANSLGMSRMLVSITHTKKHAAATAIGLRGG